MLHIEYNGWHKMYDGYSVAEAIKKFREDLGLKGKHLHGEAVVTRGVEFNRRKLVKRF